MSTTVKLRENVIFTVNIKFNNLITIANSLFNYMDISFNSIIKTMNILKLKSQIHKFTTTNTLNLK